MGCWSDDVVPDETENPSETADRKTIEFDEPEWISNIEMNWSLSWISFAIKIKEEVLIFRLDAQVQCCEEFGMRFGGQIDLLFNHRIKKISLEEDVCTDIRFPDEEKYEDLLKEILTLTLENEDKIQIAMFNIQNGYYGHTVECFGCGFNFRVVV